MIKKSILLAQLHALLPPLLIVRVYNASLLDRPPCYRLSLPDPRSEFSFLLVNRLTPLPSSWLGRRVLRAQERQPLFPKACSGS